MGNNSGRVYESPETVESELMGDTEEVKTPVLNTWPEALCIGVLLF